MMPVQALSDTSPHECVCIPV